MKYLFIVNPVSGKGRGKKSIPIIEQFLQNEGINYKLIITQYPKFATEFSLENLQNFEVVVSVGGDGTLNEVVNGIKNELIAKVKLGVLPIGSGNDFSKNIKLSKDLISNLKVICGIETNKTRKIDLYEVKYDTVNQNNQYHKFINGAGIGFDAYVGALTQNNKVLSGILAYLISVVKALFNYKMINVNVEINNLKIVENKLMITFGNGISHGGGFYLTPNAKIDDGLLDVSFFEQISRKRLLVALPKALVNKVNEIPEARLMQTKKVNLILQKPYYFHCDGEIISDNLKSAEISILEEKLQIIEMV
ncbi:MAG: diacylglycerol kinase family lipid kinase [Ignavibacteriae bacterium]|nr:diacylglycerol kinase family lipid kinase [Ignavibacteriota bacterium]